MFERPRRADAVTVRAGLCAVPCRTRVACGALRLSTRMREGPTHTCLLVAGLARSGAMLRGSLVAGRAGRARRRMRGRPTRSRTPMAVLARAGAVPGRAGVTVGACRTHAGVRVCPAHAGLRVACGAAALSMLRRTCMAAFAVAVRRMREGPACTALRVTGGALGVWCGLGVIGCFGVAIRAGIALRVVEHPLSAGAVARGAGLSPLLMLGRVA